MGLGTCNITFIFGEQNQAHQYHHVLWVIQIGRFNNKPKKLTSSPHHLCLHLLLFTKTQESKTNAPTLDLNQSNI